jgi:hypothetical protein
MDKIEGAHLRRVDDGDRQASAAVATVSKPPADHRHDRRRTAAREARAGAARKEHRPARQGAGEGASARTALFMGAMVAKKLNPVLEAFFDRLVAAGKPKMVVLIAVARKPLTILNATVRDHRPWQGTVVAAS